MLLLTLGAWATAVGITLAAQKPIVDDAEGDRRGNPFTSDFKKQTLDLMEKWHVPGLAIAVIDGKDNFFEGLGLADIASNTSVTPDTLFMGGSTTKAFTAAALGMLINSGNYTLPPPDGSSRRVPLTWRTPISSVIPSDFVTTDSWATARLTLEDAASHRTGLSRHDKSSARWYPDADGKLHAATPRDIVRSLRYLPFAEEPRTTYMYCNLMYVVLSHCVETLTGRWLGKVLRKKIWGPLGMESTFYGLEDLPRDNKLATGYYWDEEDNRFGVVDADPTPEISGAGLVISNVRDYAKWVRCQLDGGEPLGKAVHAALREPKTIEGAGGVFDGPGMYASGWTMAVYRGRRVFTHGGVMEAYGTNVVFFPDEDYGVVAMGNTAVGATVVAETVVWRLIDDRLGIPEERRFGWEKKWEKFKQTMRHKLEKPVDLLFPDRKSDPLTPSLSLEQYTGRYYHAAYQNMTLELGEKDDHGKVTLKADRTDFTWQTSARFEHVSGEYWIMFSWVTRAPGEMLFLDVAAVEFQIGVDGRASRVGVEWRDTQSGIVDGMIWYERVD
ncbi:beta-lactamase/transpeptidase-like protein [Podospora aff. communis PSN243]|uniref:Beta-lactamase/transpeptidase-like protein n=1 Tax=Podospora aff. communis PSN243 TaxID=3040156 RepID=A0AAV9H061_9PEZI|nr:beta-lactamase/transpeptidase-like protein [Podospora aff. communis PSN243]